MTPRFALGFLCCALGVVALTFADGARLVARCIAGPYAGAAPLEALEHPAPALVASAAARRATATRDVVGGVVRHGARGVGDRAAAAPLERAADPVASSAAHSAVAGSRTALGAGPAVSLAPEIFASFALARELAP